MNLVSIVLPVYNQAHYLPAALDSVFSQTYPNHELIVVDDGSTDATPAVLADYQQRRRFTVIRQANAGLPRALNAGFAEARGEYLTWTSSDNIMLPDMLAVLVQALDVDPAVGLVYADYYFIDDDGKNLGRINLPDYDPDLLLHLNLVHCSFLYRRECMTRVGLYDPEFIYGEDWEYWIRISEFYAMKRIPQALYHYRLHRGSMTSEVVRGAARKISYREFAGRMRRRMPLRWMLGRTKWWWLRLTQPDHPVLSYREAWKQAAARAAKAVQCDRPGQERSLMDLSIALVNWNNRDYLRQCLESIEAAHLPFTIEIVAADNGSTDGSLEMLAERFPYVKVVQNGKNVGVARGNNECIRNSSGQYIYVLNNDTVIDRRSILLMMEFLAGHPEAGAVGGNLLNPDGTLQASFCDFPTLREEFLLVTHIGRRLNPIFPSHNGTWPEAREVDWISSASIIVRRMAIEGIGLVDEDYFIYSDETDWQYRLRQAGWKVYYLPDVTTIHYGGGSFKPGDRRYTLVYRGRMLFARKHYGPLYSTVQRAMFAGAALGRQAAWLVLRVLPGWRSVAQRQLQSNLETLRLCFQLK